MSEDKVERPLHGPLDQVSDSRRVRTAARLFAAFVLFGLLALLFVVIHAIQNGVTSL